MAKKERISAQDVLETISGFIEVFDVEKLKKLDKLDALDELATIKTKQEELEKKFTTVEQKLSEVVKPGDFEDKLKRRDEAFNKAIKSVPTEVQVKNEPVGLAQKDRDALDELHFQLKKSNQRFAVFSQIISSKKIWILSLFMIAGLSVGTTILVMKDSAAEWAHRAFVAAEEAHMNSPAEEYSKAYAEMRGGWKSRKDCKDRIKGMESEAGKVRNLENIIYDYTGEEVEVREYKINIKKEQMARLVCYHPSTDQKVNYRIHTTPEGIVTKVEMEKKIKGKKVWAELSEIESNSQEQ